MQELWKRLPEYQAGDRYPSERNLKVERAVQDLLLALGVDVSADPNFAETPRRFSQYLLDHFTDLNEFDRTVKGFAQSVFPSSYQGMIVQAVSAVGACPHHLLPVIYNGVVAYIPNAKAIGLSKLSRVARECLKFPILQEEATLLLTNTLASALKSKSVGVLLKGKHMCMVARGVSDSGSFTITSDLRGDFLNQPDARAEFLSLARAVVDRE